MSVLKLVRSAVTIASTAAMLFAAGPTLAQSTAKTTVTYWTFLPQGGKRPRELGETKIIESFEKANPDIAVKVEVVPWDELHTKFLTAFSAGRGPDVVRVDPTQLLLHVKANSLAPLDPYVKDWPQATKDDFFLWEGTVVGGKKVAINIGQNVFTLLYRKDIFDELKLKPPASWDEFVTVAKALTTKDRWGFAYPGSRTGSYFHVVYAPLVWGAGGDVLDGQGKALLDSAASVRALTFLNDLVRVHKVAPPEVTSFNLQDVMQGFMAGKYAMVIEGANRYSSIQTSDVVKGKVGVAFMPSPDGAKPAPAYATGGWNLAINAKSTRKDAAWKFIDYYVSYEAQVIVAEVAGDFPSRRSVFQSPFMKRPENAYLQEFYDILDKASRGPILTDRWSELFDANLMQAVHRILGGEKADAVLADTATKFNAGRR